MAVEGHLIRSPLVRLMWSAVVASFEPEVTAPAGSTLESSNRIHGAVPGVQLVGNPVLRVRLR